LGVRFRAPARRGPPGAGRGPSPRTSGPCGLQAASSGSTPANASTSENGGNHSASNPPNGHATAAHARAAHRATAHSNRTSSRVCHRGTARAERRPPTRPPHARPGDRAGAPRRLPGPHRRGGCGARLWGVWAVRDSVCVSPRRGERPRPRARYAAAPRRSPLHVL